MPRKCVRPAEAAEILGIRRDTVYVLLRAGRLRSIKVGRARLIPLSAIDELLPRHVAKAAKPPGLPRNKRRALTPEEGRALLSAIVGDRLEPLFVLALATGLRRGELLGLRWSDIDLTGHVLYVRQALQRVNGQLTFVPPKTHRSARPLPLSKLAMWSLQ